MDYKAEMERAADAENKMFERVKTSSWSDFIAWVDCYKAMDYNRLDVRPDSVVLARGSVRSDEYRNVTIYKPEGFLERHPALQGWVIPAVIAK